MLQNMVMASHSAPVQLAPGWHGWHTLVVQWVRLNVFWTLNTVGVWGQQTIPLYHVNIRESAQSLAFTPWLTFLGELRAIWEVDLCWNPIFLKIILLPSLCLMIPEKCRRQLEMLYLFFLFYSITSSKSLILESLNNCTNYIPDFSSTFTSTRESLSFSQDSV